MKRLALLALVLLTGCPMSKPERPFLQCTIDDTLSFTVADVQTVYVNAGVLTVYRVGDLATINRMMPPKETCERVSAIQWELAP